MRQRRPHKKAAKPRTKPSELTKVLTDKLAKMDQSLQDLNLRQINAINQGTWVMNSMLQQLTTLQASVNQGGAAVIQMQGQLRTMDGQLHTINTKLDRVLDQTSYGQAEEDETKRRLAKAELDAHLTKMRLQKVLPFSGLEQNLQNVAPGDLNDAQASWNQFVAPATPPFVGRAAARRVQDAERYARHMR